MELSGKVALVTGGGIRIGRALVLALARAGCDVFIHYGQSADAAMEVQKEATSLGVRAVTCSVDLADPAATATVIPKAIEAFGSVDILINSASIISEEDGFAEVDVSLWDRIFAINLRAPFQLSQAFAKQTPREGYRKIININDCNIPKPAPNNFVYRLAKSGLWDMTAMMALELAPHITVNALALGLIMERQNTPDPQKFIREHAEKKVPLKKPGNTQIVADSALFLLEKDFITGITIPLDGGESL